VLSLSLGLVISYFPLLAALSLILLAVACSPMLLLRCFVIHMYFVLLIFSVGLVVIISLFAVIGSEISSIPAIRPTIIILLLFVLPAMYYLKFYLPSLHGRYGLLGEAFSVSIKE